MHVIPQKYNFFQSEDRDRNRIAQGFLKKIYQNKALMEEEEGDWEVIGYGGGPAI
jgi:hypothetical protein